MPCCRSWRHWANPCSWTTRNRNTKELAQYCQEAAVVVAMGGGFECFNILYGHGGIVQRWAIPIWRGMAAFCRQRQECFQARIRPELGIVFPAVRNDPEKEALYVGNPGAAAMRPDRFRRLFGFMESLQTRVFFFVLPDSLVRRVLDGLPDDVSFRFFRFRLLLFARLYGRCLFLGLN